MKRNLIASATATALGLLASVLIFTDIGCGGGGSSAPRSETDFCVEKAEHECETLLSKCSFPEATCVTARTAACTNVLAPSQRSTVRAFNERNISDCTRAIDSTLSKDSISPAEWQKLTDACSRVWSGNLPKQGACTSSYDCEKNLFCDKGFCASEIVKKAPDFCTESGAICAKGEYCEQISATQFGCLVRAGTGLACGTQPDGKKPLCVESLRCVAGKCVEKLAVQMSCASNDDCQTGLCEPFAMKCLSDIRFAPFTPACSAYEGKLTPAPSGDASTD
ncbi:MAG: hypothetical protein SGI86_02405 [Deltaproteobacteria bacterium]|nr:hypothetical protein [Deltaproteobacteria bacterium]